MTFATYTSPLAPVDELAADLDWVQQRFAEQQHQDSRIAAQLRLASGLVRNVLRPFLGGVSTHGPLHIAVVGGAGTGKSSVVNLLLGRAVAESNPQAGFTRHPVAYMAKTSSAVWRNTDGLLSPLRLLEKPQPSNVDENVYQIREFLPAAGDDGLFRQTVVWDCPDVTTWHSINYLPRVMEVVSLADVVVYVASDERYNDEVPTQLLRLVLQAGKGVVCCLTKMREAEAEHLLNHFRAEVLARIPEATRIVSSIALPFLDPQVLADPAGQGSRWRQPLLTAVRWWMDRPEQTRTATVRGALDFLREKEGELLAAISGDLAALRTWRDLVEQGQVEFETRYFKEYLSSKQFHRFDQSFVKLIELLELPGIGKYVSKTLSVVRLPWNLLKNFYLQARGKSASQEMPEDPILQAGLQAWLDFLRVEVARRAGGHGLYRELDRALQGPLRSEAEARYRVCLPEFRRGLEAEVERTARAIYEDIEKNPTLLNSLRSLKFSVEAGLIIMVLLSGGINIWDPIIIVVITPLIQEITEFFGKQYVETRKAEARQRQKELMSQTVAKPLRDWLVSRPTTDGSSLERLEQIVQRLPQNLGRVRDAVQQRLGGPLR